MVWMYGDTNINITTELIDVIYSLYKDWWGPRTAKEPTSDIILERDAEAE